MDEVLKECQCLVVALLLIPQTAQPTESFRMPWVQLKGAHVVFGRGRGLSVFLRGLTHAKMQLGGLWRCRGQCRRLG